MQFSAMIDLFDRNSQYTVLNHIGGFHNALHYIRVKKKKKFT